MTSEIMLTESSQVDVYIVEDSMTQAVQFEEVLRRHGFRPTIFTDPMQAMDAIKTHKPTIIVSDVILPGMDGFELSRRLHDDPALCDIPIILLTQLSEPEDIIRGLKSGADNFFTKPYDENQLMRRIHYILENRRLRSAGTSTFGIELSFAGKKHFITSDKIQILDLLLSTYESAMVNNEELDAKNRELDEALSAISQLGKLVLGHRADITAPVTTTDHLDIIIAEDSLTQAEALRFALESEGYVVRHADTGLNALEMARKRKPAVVVSDVVMPEMSGYELCSRLKQDPDLRDTPVILLTTLTSPRDIIEGLNSGADFYLTKPYNEQALIKRIQHLTLFPAITMSDDDEDDKASIEVSCCNETFNIRSKKHQILSLLLSTYENAVKQNEDLVSAQLELRSLNAELEERVHERTAELEISEANFRSILTVNADGIVVVDHNNIIQFVNPAAEAIFDTPEADLLGSPFAYNTIDAETSELCRTTEDGQALYYEMRVVDAAWQQQPARLASLRDVTERKIATKRIQQQAALLDITREAILVQNSEGEIQYWNKGCETLYGWTADEAIGQPAKSRFEIANNGVACDTIRIAREEGHATAELTHRTKSGTDILVESRWSMMYDDNKQPTSILMVNSDISAKKQAEQQLLRSQRLESLGTLAGGIAHDLNNILAPILMSTQLLKLKSTNSDHHSTYDKILTNVERGSELVRQVLYFARGVEGEHKPLQLRHLVKDIKKMVVDTFPKNITIETNIPSDLWTVSGDITQLFQVLLNLAVNARDAMSEGGTLRFVAENIKVDKSYSTTYKNLDVGRYVHITVSDTGVGIPQDVLDRIYDPFFTTKEQGKGTGLGLSTTMGIVVEHDGVIEVTSSPGAGTVFSVILPAVNQPAAVTHEPEETALPNGSGEEILIIDDEVSICEATKETLECFGYTGTTAANGAEGIALFAGRKDAIALVITDMHMPIMNGETTIRALREIKPAQKIIGMSGVHCDRSLVERSREHLDAYLAKPFTAQDLLEIVHDVLNSTSIPEDHTATADETG